APNETVRNRQRAAIVRRASFLSRWAVVSVMPCRTKLSEWIVCLLFSAHRSGKLVPGVPATLPDRRCSWRDLDSLSVADAGGWCAGVDRDREGSAADSVWCGP